MFARLFRCHYTPAIIAGAIGSAVLYDRVFYKRPYVRIQNIQGGTRYSVRGLCEPEGKTITIVSYRFNGLDVFKKANPEMLFEDGLPLNTFRFPDPDGEELFKIYTRRDLKDFGFGDFVEKLKQNPVSTTITYRDHWGVTRTETFDWIDNIEQINYDSLKSMSWWGNER